MKKRVLPRLALALSVSLTAFVLLSAVQFARNGNFTRQIAGMTFSGRYLDGNGAVPDTGLLRLDGAAGVSFGGLEFRLDGGVTPGLSALTLVGFDGTRRQVFPLYLYLPSAEAGADFAVFTLPYGVELAFSGTGVAAPDFVIRASLPADVAAVDIPFRPRRSTVTWDNGRGITGVTYAGTRRMFSRQSQELNAGRLILPAAAPSVVYRAMPETIVNSPADFITPGMETEAGFTAALEAWTDTNFQRWVTNGDADSAIAASAEAARRGNFAAAAIPAVFVAGNWESSVFPAAGRAWTQEVAGMSAADGLRLSRVAAMTAAGNTAGLFAEPDLLEFLTVRGQTEQADAFIAAAAAFNPADLPLAATAGILESDAAMGAFRPSAANPFSGLAAAARRTVADSLRQNGTGVLAFCANPTADVELNLRLGAALREWGVRTGSVEWAALGRSLTASVLALADTFPADSGEPSVPAFVASGIDGRLVPSVERIGTATLYRAVSDNRYLPRAVAGGVDGVWAWTAAATVNVTRAVNFMDIDVGFPTGGTHYLIVRNVAPFALLQIHGQTVARTPTFAGTASGWDYFADERTLVLRVNHRIPVERVRVIFTIPTPVVVAQAPPAADPEPEPLQPAAAPFDIPGLPPIRARPPTWTPPPVTAVQDEG